MDMILERLAQAASEYCGLQQDQPVLLGVSGGADSLVLAFGLEALGYPLIIAHVDHALRSESLAEAKFVRQVADTRGWPFFSQRIEVRQAAEAARQSLEEAARQVRYTFLFEQARLHQCQAVAVAHHADDQVETVLMHILRGTALGGLTGMPYRRLMPQWDPDIPLVRPLLGIWREEIEAYVETLGVEPCVDATNFDTTYFRNRLRHELIPVLQTYNPQIKTALSRMADVLQVEADWLDKVTREAYQACVQGETDESIQLALPAFLGLHKALKRGVLRLAIEQLRPDLRDIGYEAIERGLDYVEAGKAGGEIDLVARLNLAVIEDTLVIKDWSAELPDFGRPLLVDTSFEASLGLNQPVVLRHGWRITATLEEECSESPLKAVKRIPTDEAWLDYDQLPLPLTVRGAREGERFEPLGMGGQSQSLQDFFINLKIPAHLRLVWPLVSTDQRVAWVVGLRPSEAFKISEKTQRILRLKLKKGAVYPRLEKGDFCRD